MRRFSEPSDLFLFAENESGKLDMFRAHSPDRINTIEAPLQIRKPRRMAAPSDDGTTDTFR
jgi:hypothetical protein